jgi:hypothetical protein
MKIGMQIAAARRRGVRLAVAVAVALMLTPLASMQAQPGLYECTTTSITTTYRLFGIEVWREVESTTVCVQIA